MEQKILLEIQDLKKKYKNVWALNGVSYKFLAENQYVLKGSSGSGKSTLLYLLGGLDRPTEGRIWIEGRDLFKLNDEELSAYRNQFIGFIFQFHFLLSSMNCWDNIQLPAKIAGKKLDQAFKDKIGGLAENLGVSHCLQKFPYELSGGEQQRVNIIRALSLNPRLLLCDEPTGNLDSKNSEIVVNLLQQLAREHRATLLVVTHDPLVEEKFENRINFRDGQFVSHRS